MRNCIGCVRRKRSVEAGAKETIDGNNSMRAVGYEGIEKIGGKNVEPNASPFCHAFLRFRFRRFRLLKKADCEAMRPCMRRASARPSPPFPPLPHKISANASAFSAAAMPSSACSNAAAAFSIITISGNANFSFAAASNAAVST